MQTGLTEIKDVPSVIYGSMTFDPAPDASGGYALWSNGSSRLGRPKRLVASATAKFTGPWRTDGHARMSSGA